MILTDFFIGVSVVAYLGAAVSLARDGKWALAGAFVLWAGANFLITFVAGGSS